MSIGFDEDQISILESLFEQPDSDPMLVILHGELDAEHLAALSIGDRHALWNAITDHSAEIFSRATVGTLDQTSSTSQLSKELTDFQRGLVSLRLRHQKMLWERAKAECERYVAGFSGLVNLLIHREEVSRLRSVRDELWHTWQRWIEILEIVTDWDSCANYGCSEPGDWATGGLMGFMGRYCDAHAAEVRNAGVSIARWNPGRTSINLNSYQAGRE